MESDNCVADLPLVAVSKEFNEQSDNFLDIIHI